MKHFFPTDDDATELPLQNIIANEQLKKEIKSDHTRAVQHIPFLNCDHSSSSGSTADPDKNPVVSDFFMPNCDWFV